MSCPTFDPIPAPGLLWSLTQLVLGNGFFTMIFVQGVVVILIASGVMNYFQTYRRNVELLRKGYSMLDSYLGILPDPSAPKLPTLKVNSSGRSVSLLCRSSGKEYLITLPYDSSKISSFRSKRMVLTSHHKLPLDVTLPPGVAYTFTAGDLGGDRLELRSMVDSRVLSSWEKEQVPSSTKA